MANEMYSEKVSVNINSSTLSSIDLLVDNGYYSNRSDFINQALRDAVKAHQRTIDRIVDKNESAATGCDQWFIGVCGYTRKELEVLQAAGKKISVRGYGVFCLDKDLPDELVFSVIEEISVRGKVYCGEGVKKHYNLK